MQLLEPILTFVQLFIRIHDRQASFVNAQTNHTYRPYQISIGY